MNKPGPKVIISDIELNKAQQTINNLSYRDDILVALSIVLISQGKLNQKEIGTVLGVSISTVKRMIKDFKKRSSDAESTVQPAWGGDRRSFLSWEEENEVLEQVTPKAMQGQIATVADIQGFLEAKAGKKMSQQTVYNILYRHNWHKVVPDKALPKNDSENLVRLKKPFQKRYTWQPLTPCWKEKTFV